MSRRPRAVWIRSRARLSHSVGAWPVSEESGSQIDENAMGIDGGGDSLSWASEGMIDCMRGG